MNREAAGRMGAPPPLARQFLQRREHFFAEDGLHPTAAAYEYCYSVLKRRTRLVGWQQGRPSSGRIPPKP